MLHFGFNVHVIRSAKRWSQRELQVRSGIQQRRVSVLEGGLKPRPWEITALAKALGVSRETLTGPPIVPRDDETYDTQPEGSGDAA